MKGEVEPLPDPPLCFFSSPLSEGGYREVKPLPYPPLKGEGRNLKNRG